ncbi:hypothetical protein Tsubulata_032646 [Turnera subulata]|uniref:Glutaredoxin domain-containing protein n=1 Tax=Turnera subulata TaxID=218843 RepID=A0A9Q0GJQ9_9ROSI|nr:hypothetical protein Tsubulata_032646 [Turnera subulata]
MGCNSSKRVDATTDVYRPAPTSFAKFDINSIEEPWIVVDNKDLQETQNKPSHVPAPLLDKLNKLEADTPHSWDEVSKALEDLKPTFNDKNPEPKHNQTSPQTLEKKDQTLKKSNSIHTLEELDAKLSSKPEKEELKKAESSRFPHQLKKKTTEPAGGATELLLSDRVAVESGGGVIKPVKENIFILKDRLERQKEGKPVMKWDPLRDYPEKCPPGGADSVVVYTTSLRGVRRTFEDCTRVSSLLELHHVVFDERDVSLHGEFLNELRELVGEEGASALPRVFVKGRYVGGAEEVVELNESGRLGRMLVHARVERVLGRQACEGCGDATFVPCLECGGSCKVFLEDGTKERCGKCNENGLVRCPTCH